MAKSVLYMSISLDGFITGAEDGPGNGLGNGGHRLHEWLGEPFSERPHFDPPGLSGQEMREYEEPWMKTSDGVADAGFALAAWFVDPAGNTLGLLQFKDRLLG